MRKGGSQTPQFVDHGQVSLSIHIYKMMIKILVSKINNDVYWAGSLGGFSLLFTEGVVWTWQARPECSVRAFGDGDGEASGKERGPLRLAPVLAVLFVCFSPSEVRFWQQAVLPHLSGDSVSQGTSTPTPYASAVPSMHPHEMCQGCSCPWLSAPVIPTVPDTWLTFVLPLSICEDPPGSIKPQLLQEPLSSPCPFQASRHHCHRRTQHTPCFPLGWLLWSTGAHLDSWLVFSGGYLGAGHRPFNHTLLQKGPGVPVLSLTQVLPLCLGHFLFFVLFLVTSVLCSSLPFFHLTCPLSFLFAVHFLL